MIQLKETTFRKHTGLGHHRGPAKIPDRATPKVRAFIIENYDKMPDWYLAQLVGLTLAQVRYVREKLGIKKKKIKGFKESEVKTFYS